MHLDAKSNHIFFISNFNAFRVFIDYRESTVEFKRRVPLFDPGNEFLKRALRSARHSEWRLSLEPVR